MSPDGDRLWLIAERFRVVGMAVVELAEHYAALDPLDTAPAERDELRRATTELAAVLEAAELAEV